MRYPFFPLVSSSFLIVSCAAPAANEAAGLRDRTPVAGAKAAEQVSPEELQFLVGSWRITVREPGASDVTVVNYKVEPAPGGKWLTGNAGSADLSIRAKDSWGIDPGSGQILRFIFDSSGAYGLVWSQGWKGDQLVLEGEAMSEGGPTKVRETITRRGPDRFDVVWEALQDGEWTPYSLEQAQRQS